MTVSSAECVKPMNCDQEPLHMIGGIQPQGCLLVLNTEGWIVLQASENTLQILGEAPQALLQQSFFKFLNEAGIVRIKKQFQMASSSQEVKALKLQFIGSKGARPLTGLLHAGAKNTQAILELQVDVELDPLLSFIDFYDEFTGAVLRLQQSKSITDLCESVIQEVHAMTSFDRVWVHRVVEGGHLQVIAEHRRPDQNPFLGLHFPASDIPQQARRLFALNRLRLISDVDAPFCRILPHLNPLTLEPLDLSHSFLRAVSPVHLEYLKNMKVRTSMSISIVKEGVLWGLISCHHDEPLAVPYSSRAACDFLGRVVSLQIPLLEAQAEAETELELRSHLSEIQSILTIQNPHVLLWLLEEKSKHLLALANASGVAICLRERDPLLLGVTPSAEAVKSLIPFAMKEASQSLFVTDELAKVFPLAQDWTDVASGFLAVSLSRHEPFVIMWFRGEQVQTIHWGGNPQKAMSVSEDGTRMSPRKSFEKWNETLQGKSRPWLTVERKMVEEFRYSFMTLVIERAQELSQLNQELEMSNAELDAFAYVASHDLKEPLRGIHTYSTFLIEDYSDLLDEEGKKKLNRLMSMTEQMNALIESLLLYARIGRTELELQAVNLQEVVREAIDILQPRLIAAGAKVEVIGKLPTLLLDRIRIGEVFCNLISNAVKYNDQPEKKIEVACTAQTLDSGKTEYVISVKDNGIGIHTDHKMLIFQIFKRLHAQDQYQGGSGAGLTIVKRIIERHHGRIWLKSTLGEGTTFFFTLGRSEP